MLVIKANHKVNHDMTKVSSKSWHDQSINNTPNTQQ